MTLKSKMTSLMIAILKKSAALMDTSLTLRKLIAKKMMNRRTLATDKRKGVSVAG